MKRTSVVVGLGIALAWAGLSVIAGPLNPPAGPIVSTLKPLNEIEPRIAINGINTPGDADSLFKITQPGSYYLTGNIAGVVGKHGIEIAASAVTLDLNGFELVGAPAMGAFDGVSATVAGLTNVVVVDGTVRNWGNDGIDLGTVPVSGCRVEGVRVNGNVRMGVYGSPNSQVVRCSATSNQYGIYALAGSTVSDCTASGNSFHGVGAEHGSTITACSAYLNTGIGIYANVGCSVTSCSAYQNSGVGINVAVGCTVTNCSAYNNTGSGIATNSACTVTGCSSSANLASGITTNNGSTLADCTVWENTLDGILCSSGCIIRGNTSQASGTGPGNGAGIHAIGTDNRIEGNTCTTADRGIDVDVAGNIIIRNSCSGNTNNWDVVAGNVILVVNAATAAAVTGNSGGTAPGSTDPNANFTY